MADPELDAIRQRRLAQLSGGSQSPGPSSQNQSQGQNPEAAAQAAADEEETLRTVMTQILDPQARERLSRIQLVRPERARGLQELLVRMARSGQLRGRVTDEQLLSLLDQVAAAEGGASGAQAKSKITVSRRRDKTHSDDEDDDDDFRPKAASSAKTAASQADDDDDIFDL